MTRSKKPQPNNKCLNCNKEIVWYHKFCNQKCRGSFQKKQTFKKIENNEKVDFRRIKEYLIEKTNNACSICGTIYWNGKPLVKILDHIDGDSTNNKLENLRLVCSNCDSQLDTYKSKNKKSTRKYRKNYYNMEDSAKVAKRS